jgi:hypothetical protein
VHAGFTVAFTCLLLSCAEPDAEQPHEIEAFYFGFRAMSYEPVTPDNIEEMAGCSFTFSSSGESAETIRELLGDTTPAEFDRYNVRLLLRGLRRDDVYVDDHGTVAGAHGRNGARMSEESFRRLEQVIDNLAADAECILGRRDLGRQS